MEKQKGFDETGSLKGMETYMKKSILKRMIAAAAALTLAFTMTACTTTSPAGQQGSTETQEEAASKTPEAPEGEEKQDEGQDPANPNPAGQNPAKQGEKTEVKIGALKGPTALGMVGLMEKNEQGEAANQYQFTLAGAPDEIVGKVVSGELDIAAVPTNLAATLYNKTEGGVKLAALNTMGVLYILEKGDTIQSVQDLEGKTIYATGQGATPEYALNLVLSKNGLTPGENVTVEYKQEHAEIVPLLASGEAQIALLPQPFVTSVLMKDDTVRVALDLTEEWDKATNSESGLTMGCVIVQRTFAEENPEALNRFLEEYKGSVDETNGSGTMAHAAELSEKYDIMPKAVAEKAIPECNIVFAEGDEMKKIASGFLQVLFEAEPKSVGGKLPGDDFYYKR